MSKRAIMLWTCDNASLIMYQIVYITNQQGGILQFIWTAKILLTLITELVLVANWGMKSQGYRMSEQAFCCIFLAFLDDTIEMHSMVLCLTKCERNLITIVALNNKYYRT